MNIDTINDYLTDDILDNLNYYEDGPRFIKLLQYIEVGIAPGRAALLCGFNKHYASQVLMSKEPDDSNAGIKRDLMIIAKELLIARMEKSLYDDFIGNKLTPKGKMDWLARRDPDTWGLQSEVDVNLQGSITKDTADFINQAIGRVRAIEGDK